MYRRGGIKMTSKEKKSAKTGFVIGIKQALGLPV
ncbi:hypothetical protein ACUXOM_002216 [Staphylococcus epidermidis]